MEISVLARAATSCLMSAIVGPIYIRTSSTGCASVVVRVPYPTPKFCRRRTVTAGLQERQRLKHLTNSSKNGMS